MQHQPRDQCAQTSNRLASHPAKVNESVTYPLAKFLVNLGLGKAYSLDMKEPAIIIDSTSADKFEAELLSKSWKRTEL